MTIVVFIYNHSGVKDEWQDEMIFLVHGSKPKEYFSVAMAYYGPVLVWALQCMNFVCRLKHLKGWPNSNQEDTNICLRPSRKLAHNGECTHPSRISCIVYRTIWFYSPFVSSFTFKS